jgi:CRISPR-associated protein Cas1
MATYYVSEQGAVVRKQDERLLVTKDQPGGRVLISEIPMHQLEQLVVMGNVQLTTQSVAVLLQSGVDTVFMTSRGRVRGRLVANESAFAELRLKQLQAMSDDAANLELARQIVLGKLANQRSLLAQGRPTAGGTVAGGPVGVAVRGIAAMMEQAVGAGNADSLRGYEGKAGAYYWPAFKALLRRDYGFNQRIYHPSPDPVNALLSFCYSLLLKDVLAAVRLVGLDPYLGFFHTVQYGRPSLALDLMEEYRPAIDRMVLDLLNTDAIQERDFAATSAPERPLELREGSLRRVIEQYETRITALTRYPFTGEQTMLRRCIELQTRQMARVIKGEQPAYKAMAL